MQFYEYLGQAYFFNTYAVGTASVVAGKTSYWVLELSFEIFQNEFFSLEHQVESIIEF